MGRKFKKIDIDGQNRRTKIQPTRCPECGRMIVAEQCLACYLNAPEKDEFDPELFAGVFRKSPRGGKKKCASFV